MKAFISKLSILLLLTFICAKSTRAQALRQAKVDSLMMILSNSKFDSNKVNLLIKISDAFPYNDKQHRKQYANEALKIAQKIKYKEGEANAYSLIATIEDDPSGKLDNYYKSIKLFQSSNNKSSEAYVYDDIARVFSTLGDTNLAINYGLSALKLREDVGDSNEIVQSWYSLKDIYSRCNMNSNTLKYLFLILERKLGKGELDGIDWIYNNIASTYLDSGLHKKAIEYYEKSFQIFKSNLDTFSMAINYLNRGRMYSYLGDDKLALSYFEKSVHFLSILNNDDNLSIVYKDMGIVNIRRRELGKAKQCLSRSLELEKKNNFKFISKELYLALSKLDSALAISPSVPINEQIKYAIQALEYYKLYNEYADSLNTDELKQKAIQKNMLFDFQNKEAQRKAEQDKLQAIAASESKRQKVIIYSSLVGLLAAILFAIFVVRSLRLRNKQNSIIAEQKKKSDDLLLNILPSEVAEELKETGLAKAKHYDNITVLFTDFVGFTSVSETLSPTQLVAEINTCFTAFDQIIERNGLEKIKTIGDAYLAVCGLPSEDTSHAIKVIQAAKEIASFIEKHASEGGKFRIRIGIHSGSVVAGIVGIKKFAYDIWGDTVNTAARMEQHSEAGRINISGATYELVKEHFNFKHRGKIHAKNKGEIDMYFVED